MDRVIQSHLPSRRCTCGRHSCHTSMAPPMVAFHDNVSSLHEPHSRRWQFTCPYTSDRRRRRSGWSAMHGGEAHSRRLGQLRSWYSFWYTTINTRQQYRQGAKISLPKTPVLLRCLVSRCHTLATISLRCLSATVVPDLATLYLAWTTSVTTTKTTPLLGIGQTWCGRRR